MNSHADSPEKRTGAGRERCGGTYALRIVETRIERRCVHCGAVLYADRILVGAKTAAAADPDFADVVRKWAAESGFDWGDRAVSISVGDNPVVSVEGEEWFEEEWTAALASAVADYKKTFTEYVRD